MPIKEVYAPLKSAELFKDWASKQKKGRPRKRPHSFEESVPHKVFHAGLNDIISGKGLENAQLVAWRHFHADAKGNHALVEIKIGEKEDEHVLQEAHFGPMAHDHKSLLPKLKELEKLKDEDFELAYLRIFALRINTIWLRADQRDNDFFIPIAPCFNGFVAGQLYSSPDFLKLAQGAAQRFFQNNQARSLEDDDFKGG